MTPIPKRWEVPEIFRDRMGKEAGRQRTMVADGHVLVILHELPNPDEPEQRRAQLFWRNPDGAWRSTAKGSGAGALRDHISGFESAVLELENRLERAKTAEDYFEVLHVTAPTRRTARDMQRALQAAREALPKDKAVIALRDDAIDIERAWELVHSYARDGIDFTIARRSEEQARHSVRQNAAAHRLNMIMALFLPITAVGSVLGINLSHGLETSHAPWLFVAVTAGSFLLGFVVRAVVTRDAKS